MMLVRSQRFLGAMPENVMKGVRLSHRKSTSKKCLTLETLNPNVKAINYAIRGPTDVKAHEIENEMAKGIQKPFKKVYRLNIGDPQSLGQPPITFLRQVLALTTYPELMKDKSFPEDAKLRAKTVLDACPGGSVGSYSDACGIELIRRQIAKTIEERDNVPSHWKDCILGHGAGDMAKKFFSLLRGNDDGVKTGILNPVPEYPLYSSLMAELGIERINYRLDDDKKWQVDANDLQRAIDEARNTCNPRAIVVKNPGNPTGHVMRREEIEDLIRFAHRENLIIVADEVLQDNILKPDCKFVSFKKVMTEMGEPYSKMELVSLNSVSKGIFAESGIKGGYAELTNMDPEVYPMFVKSISASLCPSVLAQTAVYAQMNPPEENEPSYEKFMQEKKSIIDAFKTGATIMEECFDGLEGVTYNPIEGAIFGYPRIRMTPNMMEAARRSKISPDEFYAMKLLRETGICAVPGSAFGQQPGKYYIRMTIMPRPDEFRELMDRYRKVHNKLTRDCDPNASLCRTSFHF